MNLIITLKYLLLLTAFIKVVSAQGEFWLGPALPCAGLCLKINKLTIDTIIKHEILVPRQFGNN